MSKEGSEKKGPAEGEQDCSKGIEVIQPIKRYWATVNIQPDSYGPNPHKKGTTEYGRFELYRPGVIDNPKLYNKIVRKYKLQQVQYEEITEPHVDPFAGYSIAAMSDPRPASPGALPLFVAHFAGDRETPLRQKK